MESFVVVGGFFFSSSVEWGRSGFVGLIFIGASNFVVQIIVCWPN